MPTVGVCTAQGASVERISDALAHDGIDVSNRGEDLISAPDAYRSDEVDVVAVAIERLDLSILGSVRALVQALPEVPVIVVCARSASGDTRKALDAGVRGVVLLDEVEEALVPVLRAVGAGQVSVPGPHRNEAGKRALTTREKQVLALAARGLTNAQIAAQLFLAESTVKSHLSSAFSKLGVASRNEAASLVLDPVRGRELEVSVSHVAKVTPA